MKNILNKKPENFSIKKIEWGKIQQDMKEKLGNDIYESWLKKIDFVDEFSNYILISVSTRFIRDWITSRYLDQILQIVKVHRKEISRIEFIINDQKKEIITLMPWSREQEIIKILPIFIDVIKNFKSYQFVIAAVPSIKSKFYLSLLKNNNVNIIYNNTYNLLTHSKAALVASGTATLETALLKIPQLVCYKTSPISYFIAKRLVKLKYISLVNLILNKEVVKELIQKNCNVKKITKELKELLFKKNNSIIKDYESLIKILGSNKASEKTSQLIIDSIK